MNICKLDGCERLHKAKGYCKPHYDRFRNTGNPEAKKPLMMFKTPEYRAWCHMKERCNTPTCAAYIHYGARGITVCERWNNSFVAFYEDMGNRPTPKHSLDRIDNNKGYFPENCRWATSLQQVMNRRINSNNTSGYKGVTWDKKKNNWVAQVSLNYKHIYLGAYDDPEKAYMVYQEYTRKRQLV